MIGRDDVGDAEDEDVGDAGGGAGGRGGDAASPADLQGAGVHGEDGLGVRAPVVACVGVVRSSVRLGEPVRLGSLRGTVGIEVGVYQTQEHTVFVGAGAWDDFAEQKRDGASEIRRADAGARHGHDDDAIHLDAGQLQTLGVGTEAQGGVEVRRARTGDGPEEDEAAILIGSGGNFGQARRLLLGERGRASIRAGRGAARGRDREAVAGTEIVVDGVLPNLKRQRLGRRIRGYPCA